MKSKRILNRMFTVLLCITAGSGFLFTSCLDGDNMDPRFYFTKTEDLIGEYLSKHQDRFSEFTKILDTTDVLGLMNAYGLYTCFIPTDSAMYRFYESRGKTSLNDFSMEELTKICYNHIIKGDTIPTGMFDVGTLSTQSMSQRFIKIDFDLQNGNIKLNGTSQIVEKDIRVHNGYIHVLGDILEPSDLKLGERIAKDTRYSIFAQALIETGYADIMNKTPLQDETYDPENCAWSIKTYNIKEEIPQYRKYGFTVLVESDSMLANYRECPDLPNGVQSVDDLEILAKYFYSFEKEGFYTDGEGVSVRTNPRNYLNRYIAYHCMNRQLPASRFIDDYDTPHMIKTYDMYEFIETMLPGSLLKVVKKRAYPLTFFLNMYDESNPSTGIQFTDSIDRDAINGAYHEIDQPLAYTRNVVSYIASNRIRIEASCFFREFATNNMRGNNPTGANLVNKAHRYIIPDGYCENLECSATTRFTYLNANGIYEDYQGDEIYVEGTYNFTIKTYPIPPGTYEIRMGYQPTAYRGIAQLYWDGVPCGIPLNLGFLANDPEVGWEMPGSNLYDQMGYENDKMMHNRGYMKGPACYKCTDPLYYDPNKIARTSTYNLRRVLGTYTFTKATEHTFKVVGLGSTTSDIQFMLDYLEFVPTELLETEGIE